MGDLTFRTVSQTNAERAGRWHHGFPGSGKDGWTGADWSNAMAGEAGEACNVVKKLRRIETGIQQASAVTRDELLAKLATEIGDTFMYLDLLAQHYGLNLAHCVVNTFNRVSEREGFPERLDPLPMAGDEYNGFTLMAYDIPDNRQDYRVEFAKDGEIIREFTYPAYKIWTLLAHWRDNDEVHPVETPDQSAAVVDANLHAMGVTLGGTGGE